MQNATSIIADFLLVALQAAGVIVVILAVVFILLGKRRKTYTPMVDEHDTPCANETGVDGPFGAPVSDEEVEALKARINELALPAARFVVQKDVVPHDPMDSHIGGPVWMPGEEQWPQDRSGRPMMFLAQINFAEAPRLPDFPTEGVLQVFIASDDLHGADFDAPDKSEIHVVWREDWNGEGLRRVPLTTWDDSDHFTPLQSENVHKNGARIAFDAAPVQMPPTSGSWLWDELGRFWNRSGHEKFESLLENCDEMAEMHHLGGHPSFTQNDFRREGLLDDYNRVVLQLTSDDSIMWGDVGEACFLIRREDLLARDFSKIAFSWDCC